MVRVIFLSVVLIISLESAQNDNLESIKEVTGEITDVVNVTDFDAPHRFYIGMNVISAQMNDDVTNSEAKSNTDDSSYHYELSMLFNSTRQSPFGVPDSVKSYYSLHLIQRTISGYDDSYWSEKGTMWYVIYGEKYFLKSGHTGAGFGWYAGVGNYSGKNGYYWYSSGETAYSYMAESTLELIAAGELFYHIEIDKFYITPRVAGGINQNTFEFSLFPQLLVGMTFEN